MSTKSCPVGVLLIEDYAPLRSAIGAALEERGYPTALADSVPHALQLLEGLARPCLVLVDPTTIRIDWRQLFAALGADDRVATIPMVLETLEVPELLSRPVGRKRLIDFDILFRIVKNHCCGEDGAPIMREGNGEFLRGGE